MSNLRREGDGTFVINARLRPARHRQAVLVVETCSRPVIRPPGGGGRAAPQRGSDRRGGDRHRGNVTAKDVGTFLCERSSTSPSDLGQAVLSDVLGQSPGQYRGRAREGVRRGGEPLSPPLFFYGQKDGRRYFPFGFPVGRKRCVASLRDLAVHA